MVEQALWLALCIYMEARGETQAVQVKVAHVVMNRTVKRKKSVKEIVTEPNQFSWYTGSVPKIKNFYAFVECAESAKLCLEEQMKGRFFNNADHFFDDSITKPYWARKMKLVEKAGAFYFYRS